MAVKKTSTETFRNDLRELVDALNDETVTTLNAAREMQLAARALIGAEAVRLTAKLGAEAPRVQALKTAAAARVEMARALDVEAQIAAVRVPRVEQTDTLLHGRITDQSLSSVAGVEVQLTDAKGNAIADLPAVQTDAQGYYAFVLKPEQAAALAKQKLAVSVVSSGQSVKPTQSPVTLAPGATLVQEVRLNDDELARLKVRPGAADLGLRRTAKPARKRTTTGKSQSAAKTKKTTRRSAAGRRKKSS
ncbi:MAG TPA: hypothetical protein VLW45_06525 [Pelomicrobium sp.]|nr:hypothetical protein [Pelomicrobium sp.]